MFRSKVHVQPIDVLQPLSNVLLTCVQFSVNVPFRTAANA